MLGLHRPQTCWASSQQQTGDTCLEKWDVFSWVGLNSWRRPPRAYLAAAEKMEENPSAPPICSFLSPEDPSQCPRAQRLPDLVSPGCRPSAFPVLTWPFFLAAQGTLEITSLIMCCDLLTVCLHHRPRSSRKQQDFTCVFLAQVGTH